MTEQELRKNIAELRTAAEGLSGPERAARVTEIDLLEMRLAGTGLDQVADAMAGIDTPGLKSFDAKIAAAKDATKNEQERNRMITDAIGEIKILLGLS